MSPSSSIWQRCPDRARLSLHLSTQQSLRLSLTLAGFSLSAWSAVAGVPEPPRPGPSPAVWIGWSNDSYGGEIGRNNDDHRTNSFNLGISWDDAWLIGVDHSMLTDRYGTARRTDQLTATVGRMFVGADLLSPGDRGSIAVGAGVRLTGSYGGQTLQNRWHDTLQYERVQLPADTSRSEAVLWSSGQWLWLHGDDAGADAGSGVFTAGHFGVQVDGSGLLSSGGQALGQVGISAVVLGVDGSFRIGLAQAAHAGAAPNATAEAVAMSESGTLLTYGASAGGWYFEGSYDIQDRASMGKVGWMWGRRPARTAAGTISEMEGIFGIYQGYALGFQYRWQPEWLRDVDLFGERLTLLADYRFGRYPGPEWNHNAVVTRQPLLGIDCELGARHDEFQCIPFVYAAAGVREERVRVDGSRARFPNQSAIRAVLQGGGGLRFTWGTRIPTSPDEARYGISFVYDYWLPLGTATATNPATGDQDTYMKPTGSLGTRLTAAVAW